MPENLNQILSCARPPTAEPWQNDLVRSVLTAARDYSSVKHVPEGDCYAAGFDLIVAAHYYGNVTNRGWLYCGPQNPLLLYPYTNTCPRCALQNQFYFHKANKPRSGSIGAITSNYLCLCYSWLLRERLGREIQVLVGKEPIDMVFIDYPGKSCLLAEVKASPLVTFPLAVKSDVLTEENEGGTQKTLPHQSEVVISRLVGTDFNLFLPSDSGEGILFQLGTRTGEADGQWAGRSIKQLVSQNGFRDAYFGAWLDTYNKYKRLLPQKGSYWMTNSCGEPDPRPATWARRSAGTGFETVSDNKTSVGMDRTDDIKKGTYQALKIGSVIKLPERGDWHVAVGLVSNIHAVQHYQDYLKPIADVIWTISERHDVRKASDLPPEMDMANLFDGIISFTYIHIRDKWLTDILKCEK